MDQTETPPDFTWTTGADITMEHRRFIDLGYYGEVHEVRLVLLQ
jgi:hypothetical protein